MAKKVREEIMFSPPPLDTPLQGEGTVDMLSTPLPLLSPVSYLFWHCAMSWMRALSLSLSRSVCLSVSLSLCLSLGLSVCLSLSLSLSLWINFQSLFVYLCFLFVLLCLSLFPLCLTLSISLSFIVSLSQYTMVDIRDKVSVFGDKGSYARMICYLPPLPARRAKLPT